MCNRERPPAAPAAEPRRGWRCVALCGRATTRMWGTGPAGACMAEANSYWAHPTRRRDPGAQWRATRAQARSTVGDTIVCALGDSGAPAAGQSPAHCCLCCTTCTGISGTTRRRWWSIWRALGNLSYFVAGCAAPGPCSARAELGVAQEIHARICRANNGPLHPG